MALIKINIGTVPDDDTGDTLRAAGGKMNTAFDTIDAEKIKQDNHLIDHTNPHSTTKDQVGLSNVDNTKDADKPISTLTQSALDNKVETSKVLTDVPANALFTDTVYNPTSINEHIVNTTTNPHNVGKATINLGNVDNTSDANKPISTSVQNALDNKANANQILTDVPLNAIFTDTIYDDSKVLRDADVNTAITDTNKLATMEDVSLAGGGDMMKSVYDVGNKGKVDTALNAEKVNNLTVETAVPENALFTDTVYNDSGVLKTSDVGITIQELLISSSNIKTINNESILGLGNLTITGTGPLGDMEKITYDTNNNGIVDNAEKVNNLTVLKAVPVNALFTDTVYVDTTIQAEVDLNTAKNGITAQQTSDIVANNAKITNVNHPVVGKEVPSNAIFTDTTYSVGDGQLSENNLTNILKTKYDEGYTHSQASHAPTNADNTAANETSHTNVLMVANIGVSVQAYNSDIVIDSNYTHTDNNLTNTLKTNYDTAYTHSQSAHASANAILANAYAGETYGGTLKVRLNGTSLYISNTGTNP